MAEIHQHWMDDPDYDVAEDYEEVLSLWTRVLMLITLVVGGLILACYRP